MDCLEKLSFENFLAKNIKESKINFSSKTKFFKPSGDKPNCFPY